MCSGFLITKKSLLRVSSIKQWKGKRGNSNGFRGNESKYREIFTSIDNKWSIQLHHPLHAAGLYLNVEWYYCNPLIENNGKVLGGLCECIEKLNISTEFVDRGVADI